jgi:hypothetical protein
MQGLLSLDSSSGCKGLISGTTLSANDTLQVYFDTQCKLPNTQLTGTSGDYTTYLGTGTWSAVRNAEPGTPDTGMTVITTTSDSASIEVFAEKTVTCTAGSYLPANKEVCETCTEGNYCLLASGLIPDYEENQGISACPASWTSDAGAMFMRDCYYPVTLDKNGFSATLTAGSGCDVVDFGSTINATLKVHYNTACTLPTVSLDSQRECYQNNVGWAATSVFTAAQKQRKSISASTSVPSGNTYYLVTDGCAEGCYAESATGLT